MSSEKAHPAPEHLARSRRVRLRLLALCLAALLVAYLVFAYFVAPLLWDRYADHHSSFDDNPRLTETGDGHPGGPLNVALIGSEAEVRRIFGAGKWFDAEALGMESDVEIAVETVLKRPDPEAPVSKLYLFRRPEDLAFEQPVDGNPRQRNHVRFWRTKHLTTEGRSIWIGAASYDTRVGLSHTTGQVTHHIAPDVDQERDHIFKNLNATGQLTETYTVPGFQKVLKGRNGGGDPWHTDGSLWVGIIAQDQSEPQPEGSDASSRGTEKE
jgi:hypothetical protein